MSLYPEAHFVLSANSLTQLPNDGSAEVAFAGRSNAGKSTAINAIVERKALARSSKTPGRTQLINLFNLDERRRLVDLPGYGYAKVPAEMQVHWQTLVGGYLQSRSTLRGLFLLVDSRRGLKNEEREMLSWAQARLLPTRVLLSKADKLTRQEGRVVLRAVEEEIEENREGDWLSVQLFSAESKQGVEDAREGMETMLNRAG